jgi:hypothetical protein
MIVDKKKEGEENPINKYLSQEHKIKGMAGIAFKNITSRDTLSQE